MLHLYSHKLSIFVLKLCRVSPTINDTFQNMKRAEDKSNIYLTPVNITSNLCLDFERQIQRWPVKTMNNENGFYNERNMFRNYYK